MVLRLLAIVIERQVMFPREEVGEGGSFETNQLERLTRSLVTIRNYLSSLDSFLREESSNAYRNFLSSEPL